MWVRDNEMIAKGDINRMREDAKGMYEEGIPIERIARIQKTTVDVVRKMLGQELHPTPEEGLNSGGQN